MNSEEITFDEETDFTVIDRNVSIFYLNEEESTYIEKCGESSLLINEEFTIDLTKPYEIVGNKVNQLDISIDVEQINFFKHITTGEELL